MGDAVQFSADGTSSSQVLPLTSDKIRDHTQSDIGNRVNDVAPEDGLSHFESVIESAGAQACFRPGEAFSAKQRIVLRHCCPLAKAAIQLVESWSPEAAVARDREREIATQIPNDGKTR